MSERRVAARSKSLLQGRVYYNNRRASLDCVIRDITSEGARLKFSGTVTVPQTFELYIPHKHEAYRAKVAWHRGEEIGVTFDGVETAIESPSIASSGASIEDRVAKLEHELAALRRKLDAVIQVVPGASTSTD